MNLDQARKFIECAINSNIVVMLTGGPGIGKSALVKQVGEDRGWWVNDTWRLAQCDPTDIRGIPIPNRETKCTEWYGPASLPQSNEDRTCVNGPGILFFDEIDKATPAVKNAALQVILDRAIGDYHLPTDVALVCAGNHEEDNCFSIPLGMALSNRMVHAEVEHNIDVWVRWALTHDVEEDIIGFLQFNPKMLYNPTGQSAFPSPRSWEMASRMLKHGNNEAFNKLIVTGAVGEGTMVEYMTYSKVYKNVNTEEIVTKGILPTMKKDNPSFNYAVTTAVAMHVRNKNVKKYHDNIVKFLNHINPELRVVFFRQQTQQCITSFAKDPQFSAIIKDIMSSFEI